MEDYLYYELNDAIKIFKKYEVPYHVYCDFTQNELLELSQVMKEVLK